MNDTVRRPIQARPAMMCDIEPVWNVVEREVLNGTDGIHRTTGSAGYLLQFVSLFYVDVLFCAHVEVNLSWLAGLSSSQLIETYEITFFPPKV